MKLALIASFIIATFAAQCARAAEAPDTITTVSAGVAVLPEYMGAEKRRVLPVLLVDYQNKNGFFISSLRGLGYRDKVDGVDWSAAVAWTGYREDHRRTIFGSDALKGMGRIDGGLTAKLGAGYHLGPVELAVDTELAISNRERGNNVGLSASVPLMTDKSDTVALSTAIKYADRKQMQTYYGVTAAQSARSGYAAYTPKAGVSEVSVGGNWTHVIDAKWSVRSVAGVTRLGGDAASSPLTKHRNNPFLASTVNYSF
ncbi:MAG: MipA/OmpV family protein [Massilia sp.]